MIFAAMLVEPDAECELKDLGSILATSGRLSMNGEMFTPEVQKKTKRNFMREIEEKQNLN